MYDRFNIVVTRDVIDDSMQVVLAQNSTIYDAIYVALAQQIDGKLFTSDQNMR